MGHKVHPTGFRLGVIKGWESRWYATRTYKDLLAEDRTLRDTIRKRLANAGISRIEIERVANTQIAVAIHTARPGIVIGKSGESVDRLRQDLERLTKKKIRLSIIEIRNPDVDAFLVARSIADQLEKRVSFRRAMKQAVQKSMRQGAKGIKVVMGGRLGGAEIARVEKEVEGSVPLQTLRADIDYGLAEAHTTFGVIGVKVWIYHGDVLSNRQRQPGASIEESAAAVPQPGERFGRQERGDRGPRTGGPGGDRGPRSGGYGGGDRGPRGGGGGFGGGDRGPRSGGPGGGGFGGGDRGPRSGGPGGGGFGGDRGPRPQGGPGGDRGPRSGGTFGGGDRGPRPQGGPGGDRGPRPQGGPGGDRGPRPQGGAQGSRPAQPRPEQPEGQTSPTASEPVTTPMAQAPAEQPQQTMAQTPAEQPQQSTTADQPPTTPTPDSESEA